jgi:hypothetical protein
MFYFLICDEIINSLVNQINNRTLSKHDNVYEKSYINILLYLKVKLKILLHRYTVNKTSRLVN